MIYWRRIIEKLNSLKVGLYIVMKTNFSTEYNPSLIEEEIQKIGLRFQISRLKNQKIRKSFIVSLCFPILVEDFIWDT